MIMIFGEITTKAVVNYEAVIRDAIKHIGYDDVEKGLDYKTVNVIVAIEEQSPDIAQGVHIGKAVEDIGAPSIACGCVRARARVCVCDRGCVCVCDRGCVCLCPCVSACVRT